MQALEDLLQSVRLPPHVIEHPDKSQHARFRFNLDWTQLFLLRHILQLREPMDSLSSENSLLAINCSIRQSMVMCTRSLVTMGTFQFFAISNVLTEYILVICRNVMTEDEDQDSPYKRYVGKASQISLIQQAMLAEEQLRKPGKGLEQESVKPRKSSIPTTWTSSPSQTRPNYAWPDQELMDLLIDSYFTQLNCVIPLLHRPTFTAQIAQGLHMQDVEFGGTVLLVCAIGTRMTEDPRVFIHGTKERNGSKWADQVRVIERSTFTSTSLHLLQIYCVRHRFCLIETMLTLTPYSFLCYFCTVKSTHYHSIHTLDSL